MAIFWETLLIKFFAIIIFSSIILDNLVIGGGGAEDEDETYFTRIDDMIFRTKRVKAGLTSYIFRWQGGLIPYKLEKGLPDELLEMIEDAMELLEAHTCIRFIEKTAETKYVYISYTEKGCFSHVGMVNRGRQKLNLGNGCWRLGTIIHELIHTIGFMHQHQRNDRNEYLNVMLKNVAEGKEHNFKLDKEMGFESSQYYVPYNFASVMHYGPLAFSGDDEPTIIPKKLSELSSKDFIYGDVDEEGRPIIGLRKLTWGDVRMINLMYKNEC